MGQYHEFFNHSEFDFVGKPLAESHFNFAAANTGTADEYPVAETAFGLNSGAYGAGFHLAILKRHMGQVAFQCPAEVQTFKGTENVVFGVVGLQLQEFEVMHFDVTGDRQDLDARDFLHVDFDAQHLVEVKQQHQVERLALPVSQFQVIVFHLTKWERAGGRERVGEVWLKVNHVTNVVWGVPTPYGGHDG